MPDPSEARTPGERSLPLERLLVIFLDGVGIGPRDPSRNPFFAATYPALGELLEGSIPSLEHPKVEGARALAFPLDPLLGVAGVPQSGTGQTALLTGENAPRLFGRHFGPWVPVALRPLLAEGNVFTVAIRRGIRCAFANAHPTRFLRSSRRRRPAAIPFAAEAAGLLSRNEQALARGEALSSEIVNHAWRTTLGLGQVPAITPFEAGRNLAAIAAEAQLTFFAHYGTDRAGHQGDLRAGVEAIRRVDEFLAGLLPALPPDTLLLLTSDHGNLEDASRAGHTENPTFNLAAGNLDGMAARNFEQVTDLLPFLLERLTAPSS